MKNHPGLKSVCFGSFIGEFYPYLRWVGKAYPPCKPASRWLLTPSGQTDAHAPKSFLFWPRSSCQKRGCRGRASGRWKLPDCGVLPPAGMSPASSPRQTTVCASRGSRRLPTRCRMSFYLPTLRISVPFFYFLKMCLFQIYSIFFFECLISVMLVPSFLVSSHVSHTRQIFKGL